MRRWSSREKYVISAYPILRPGKLPKPTVEMVYNDDMPEDDERLGENAVRGMLCNPIYAGIKPFPAIIDDERWVRCAMRMIDDEGVEQFLVNMLYMLRRSYEGFQMAGEKDA